MPSGFHPRHNRFASQAQARFFFANDREGADRTAHAMMRAAGKGQRGSQHPIRGLPQKVDKGLRSDLHLMTHKLPGYWDNPEHVDAVAPGGMEYSYIRYPHSSKEADEKRARQKMLRRRASLGVGSAASATGIYAAGKARGRSKVGKRMDAWAVPDTQFEVPREADPSRYGAVAVRGRRIVEKGLMPTTAKAPALTARGAKAAAKLRKTPQAVPTAKLGTPKLRSFGKAYRQHDPEAARQRRLGGAAAASGLVGAHQVYRGGQSVKRASRKLAEMKRVGDALHEQHELGHSSKVLMNLADNIDRGAMLVHRGPLARIAGGAALIGASGSIANHARSPRNRKWN